MDAVKFLQERKRMFLSGDSSLIYGLEDGMEVTVDPEVLVRNVEQWSAAHPRKTRQDLFLEQYPNAKTSEKGTLYICPIFVDKNATIKYPCICSTNCSDCRREFWSQEAE